MSTELHRLTPSDLDSIMKIDDNPEKTGDKTDSDNSTDSDTFASVMLLNSILYLQPGQKTYYPLWNNISSGKLHKLGIVVINGVISSCMDGYYIEENPKIMMWDTSMNIGLHPVRMDFSRYLQAIESQVSFQAMYKFQ